ncbi:MAG TPA: DUF4375 domain-containing protein [Silvibacterium sp.]|nr:DUF4375 domain-containing protein [Silvibacterium sp.]
MAEQDFLDRAADYAFAELERVGGDPLKLDTPLLTIAVLYHFQGMVDNGAFRYAFENNFPFSPPYSMFADAYRRIGATQAAENLERSVAMFPFENPHEHEEERNAFMDSLNESDKFFELGDEVCGDESIWTAMEEYAVKHAASFHL